MTPDVILQKAPEQNLSHHYSPIHSAFSAVQDFGLDSIAYNEQFAVTKLNRQ
jgi:hypothetical protein